ncbi:ATP-binding cassette domain-containing protein [Mucilaginibacter gotjawali]|uniref:ABC-type multidrug transport system fused ATPase/permease subunit n=1 Tax=Mucilaginibacter gotjawali TaxID=1550579 RepID=A0A839SDA3_9SPHI|nr:ABC transporter ATP-binding protein [Mucilaginibacter gotjawali]MBB3054649.1 ABC-type multidrug transport system fused ATPase/permease subunit [Mucilaginibacter gotjawali]
MLLHAVFDSMIGLLDIVFLGGLLIVVNFYTSGELPGHPVYLQSISHRNPLLLVSTFLLLFSLKNWFGYLLTKKEYAFFYNIASRLSQRNVMHYLQGNYVQFVNTDSSVFFRKISQQPVEFSNYILTNLQQIISQSILIFFTITAILFYHPGLFISLFLLLLPPVILLGWMIKKKLKHIRADIKINSQLTIQHLQESLSGYVESNIYDKNPFFTDRYYKHQQQMNNHIATQQTLQSLPSRLIETFAVLGFFILIAVNKLSASVPAISLLTIGVFMAAAYKIIPGIIKILNSAGQIKTYQFTLNDLASPTGEMHHAKNPGSPGSINSIQFENIHFKYKHHDVLNGTSFYIVPGDFVGMSAPSGKGKTTIINLLLGFLEPDSGTITVNDKKTDAADRMMYRGNISYVKQQPFFIHDTILKNITLAEDGFKKSKLDEVIAFCGLAQLLEKYPEGLQKVIRENGKNISGGQRQRIMLARALYHDFDLLILDEPFGEMDDFSERTILIRLQELALQGKMILFITHNKASLSFCNKIFSMDEAYA